MTNFSQNLCSRQPIYNTIMESGMYPTRDSVIILQSVWDWIPKRGQETENHSLFNGKYDCYWNRQNKKKYFPFPKQGNSATFKCIYWQKSIGRIEKTWKLENLGLNHGHMCVICDVIVPQSCLTLCDPMDYSLPGFSVHGILQARILE